MSQDQLWEQFYRSMLRVRRVEEKIIDVYWSDKIKSPVHLSIGQEAVATGVCEALEPEDILFAFCGIGEPKSFFDSFAKKPGRRIKKFISDTLAFMYNNEKITPVSKV